MRNRFFSLYLALLNDHYGFSAAKYYFLKKRQRTWEPILVALSLLPALVMGIVFLWKLTEQLFLAGLAFGQPHLALVNGALLVSVAGLFFGFFSVLSAFYFSQDLPALVPLPLRSWEILSAKLGVVLTGQYALNLLILLPLWIRYGLLAQAGVGYVLSAVVVFFALPVLPLAVASLLAVLLMRVVNISRYRDKLTLFGGILLLVVVLGFQYWLQNSLGTDDPNLLMEQLLSQADGLIKAVSRTFPPSLWAAQAMAYAHTAQGWLNLLYLVVASLVGVGVLYLIGEKVFFAGLLAGLEGSRGSRRKRMVKVEQREGRPIWTLANLEWKLFVRDPGFALNGLVGYVILPVMVLLPLFGQTGGNNPFAELNLAEFSPFLVAGGIALYFMSMTGLSMIPGTTFSREGSRLWIVRGLPLTIGELILAKAAGAQIVNTVGCLLGVVVVSFLLGWNWGAVLAGSLLGILLAWSLAVFLIIIDLRKPMLDWVNPVKAVKSNLNALVGMLLGFGFAFGLGALFYLNANTDTLWLIPVELLAAALLLGALDLYLVKQWAPQLWARIGG